jgi:hypothetical protein
MDFWMTIRVLLRRWYIALPVFVVSLGLAGVVFFSVSAQYESTATIVLTSPSTGATVGAAGSASGEKINPLLAFDGSLTTSAQIVIETLKDPATLKQYENVDGMPAAVAVGNGQLAGPFIVVVVTAGTADAATKTTAGVLDLARRELTARQQSLQAPESTYIRADSVVSPTPGKALIGGKVRYAAVALVLGLIAGLTAAYGYESYKNYRRIHPEKGKKDRAKAEKSIPAERPALPDGSARQDKIANRFAEQPSVRAVNGNKSEDVTRVLSPVPKPNPNPNPPNTPRQRDPR